MRLKSNIANFITLFNLLCGSIAIYFLFREEYMNSLYFILAAAFFDFSDGFIARALKIKSAMGKQLDSLADVVSFGLAPGIVLFQMMANSFNHNHLILPEYTSFLAFLIPVFSAWRLAKFNIDDKQSFQFRGLPTPACGLFIFSLLPTFSGNMLSPLFPWHDEYYKIITHPAFLLSATLLLSFLLVSNIPLMAFKFKSFSWEKNKIKYVFLIISVLLFILFYFVAVPFILILYIVISFFETVILSKSKKKHEFYSRN